MPIDMLLASADWDQAAQGCELLLAQDPGARLLGCHITHTGRLVVGSALGALPHARRIGWYLMAHTGQLRARPELLLDEALLGLPALLSQASSLERLRCAPGLSGPLSRAILSALPASLRELDTRGLHGAHAHNVPPMAAALPAGCRLLVSEALYWDAPAPRGLDVEIAPLALPQRWHGECPAINADLTLSLFSDGSFQLRRQGIALDWSEVRQRRAGAYRFSRTARALVLSTTRAEIYRGPRCLNNDCPDRRRLHVVSAAPCTHRSCGQRAPGWEPDPSQPREETLRLSWDGSLLATGQTSTLRELL